MDALAWTPDGRHLVTSSKTSHSWTFFWESSNDNSALHLWAIKLQQRAAIYKLVMEYGNIPALNTQHIRLTGATGLNDQSQILRLLRQRSETSQKDQRNVTLQGEPSATRTSEEVIKERNAQVHIPEGIIKEPWLKDPSGSFAITPNEWLVAITRWRTEGKNRHHIWLVIQGLTPKHYTVIQEIHFFMDQDQPMRFKKTLGKGLIQIRTTSPFDMKEKARQLEAKCWSVSKTKIDELLRNVNADKQRDLGYILSGRAITKFSGSNAYNCLSWCEKQLTQIGIQPRAKKWIDFLFAVPDRYLPSSKKKAKAPEQGKKQRSRLFRRRGR